MKESRRAKRMSRHHSRRSDRTASLNMVSLMDIFTILVFFLLVNASSSEILPTPKAIKLPDSVAQKTPKENIVIMVNNKDILIQGKSIARVDAVLAQKHSLIQPLTQALRQIKQQKQTHIPKGRKPTQNGVTIMGDKQIPYALLKKIMLSCASADFSNISLAVVHKNASKGGS